MLLLASSVEVLSQSLLHAHTSHGSSVGVPAIKTSRHTINTDFYVVDSEREPMRRQETGRLHAFKQHVVDVLEFCHFCDFALMPSTLGLHFEQFL